MWVTSLLQAVDVEVVGLEVGSWEEDLKQFKFEKFDDACLKRDLHRESRWMVKEIYLYHRVRVSSSCPLRALPEMPGIQPLKLIQEDAFSLNWQNSMTWRERGADLFVQCGGCTCMIVWFPCHLCWTCNLV